MRLIQFPIGIFGVAMGMAVLPSLSEHAVKGNFDRLREDFSFALRLLFFISVPAMAGLIALREPIVNLLFQRGQFDYIATERTAEALLFYSIGIWSIVGVRLVTATFYSMQDTKTPMKIAVVGVLLNLILSLALMGPLKHSGLALANTLASGINFLLLFYFLRRRLSRVEAKRIIRSFLKIAAASAIMGLFGWLVLHGDLWTRGGNTAKKIFLLGGTAGCCIAIYVMASFIFRNEEMGYLYETLKKRYSRKSPGQSAQ
jgi:putative peptidoglycan lipid II flippase